MGNVEDAEKNLNRALEINTALHGRNHRTVAATLNYLAYVYQQMLRVREGREILERAVEIMKTNYSPSHPGNLPRF